MLATNLRKLIRPELISPKCGIFLPRKTSPFPGISGFRTSTGNLFGCSSSHRQKFDNRLVLDNENVFSSAFRVTGYKNVFLHECVWRDVDKWADKTALVCSATDRSYTYAQLQKLTRRLSNSFRKLNLNPGDTIALILPNILEYPIIILAASEAHLKITLLNTAATSTEMKRQLDNSGASVIFTDATRYPVALKSIENNRNIKAPLVLVKEIDNPSSAIDSRPADTIKFEELIQDGVPETVLPAGQFPNVSSEDTLFLPYSSGTTGLPKGVELSHRNIVANITQHVHESTFLGIETTKDNQDILPVILPMYHIFGLVIILLVSLQNGSQLVLLPKFSPIAYLQLLEKHRQTLFYAVPPILQMLTLSEHLKPQHFESTRAIVSGAAPIGPDSISAFKKRAGEHLNIVQGYGLSETSPVVATSKDCPYDSVGYLVPNTRARIVQTESEGSETVVTGKNLGVNEVGEIYVKGPQVMKGYFNNPKATADTFDGEWFKTGDLGSFDDKGRLYIKGRSKELIKTKGFQVAPTELEEVIRMYDKIADVAVIGIAHEIYGQVPKAFVVPKSNMKIDPDEVKEYVAERVPKYKRLADVQIVENIPKSPAGKILRRLLEN